MKIEKPMEMEKQAMLQLKGIYLAPYIQLATALVGKSRHAGGNMFRHQIDTMGILIDYGYIDSVLLKASVIHDLVEDVPGYNHNLILEVDSEASQVYDLVLEHDILSKEDLDTILKPENMIAPVKLDIKPKH